MMDFEASEEIMEHYGFPVDRRLRLFIQPLDGDEDPVRLILNNQSDILFDTVFYRHSKELLKNQDKLEFTSTCECVVKMIAVYLRRKGSFEKLGQFTLASECYLKPDDTLVFLKDSIQLEMHSFVQEWIRSENHVGE